MKKLFTFARVTKMNDMFLDMNNTFAKTRENRKRMCGENLCENVRRLHSQHVCEKRQDANAFESSCEATASGTFIVGSSMKFQNQKTGMRNAQAIAIDIAPVAAFLRP